VLLTFLLKIFFFFLIPLLPGYYFFSFVLKEENNPAKALIYSIGLSPVLNLLLLYYLLYFFPGMPLIFYLALPLFLMCLFFVFTPKTALHLKQIKAFYYVVIALSFVFTYLFSSAKILTEHDTFEYALQGKHFFKTLSVYYTQYPFHPENGFYYVGLHGFAFPLIYTWELMFNQQTGTDSIILFKLINPLYAFLLLLLVYEEVKTFGERYARWAVLFLALSTGFIFNALQFHLEMFRHFVFILSLVWMYRCFIKFSKTNFLVLCAILGLQATIHSIGAISSAIQFLLITIYFMVDNQNRNVILPFIGIFILIVFGWIHYILDIFIGTGWVVK
jgi:hypothetical protein